VACTVLSPDALRITVRDTGDGLSAEQLGKLFQPFNRLGRETGVEEGTGIGLVVTQKLVHLMGGTIGAESTPGVGSMFWVDLTRAAPPKPSRQVRTGFRPPRFTPAMAWRSRPCSTWKTTPRIWS
jgi:signal transduction histidine kinase